MVRHTADPRATDDGQGEFRGTERFEVVGHLGSGAMGVVYDVLDRDTGSRVALKTLASPSPEELFRLKTEFRAVRDIRHTNLVSLGELFEEEGRWFFTMERIDGVPLMDYVRGAPLARGATRTWATSRNGSTWPAPPESAPGSDATVTVASVRYGFDEERLRRCLLQIADGLAAIHRAGKVHRDLKPANVLVDRDGRVVILDFGVVAELAGPPEQAGELVGTIHYMAPEQAEGGDVGPPADWYALGVILFEALTGDFPFAGRGTEVLEAKLLEDPPSPRSLAPDVPADLDALCLRLLSRSPEERPSQSEVREVLGAPPTEPEAAAALTGSQAFVGREREREAIQLALEDAAAGAAVTLFVEGASGLGKSATVQRALEDARARGPRFVLLRGRCHEKELVPYNAFDGVVDDLSRYLRRFADDGNEDWVPTSVDALIQVFPVLRSVDLLAPPERAPSLAAEAPIDVRRRAATQLRELLAGVARLRPVVVCIEDAHWADSDSVELLGDLTAPPEAPPVLFLVTARPNLDGPCAAVLAAQGDVRRVVLGGLSLEEGRALVARLVAATPGAWADDVDSIVRETDGHPMFIDELVRHLALPAAERAARVRLDDALLVRVDGLPASARALLEVVSVAGTPVEQRILAEVSAQGPAVLTESLAVLRGGRLVRARGSRRRDSVEPYHDRVREAVYDRLAPAHRARLHRALAVALEEGGAPSELLFAHYSRAGDRARAAHHALAAAAAAEAALAFGRAANLYQFVLGAKRHDPEEERPLLCTLANVLAQAGRPADAGAAFARAASTGQPPREERLELRRRAVEQYLAGGYLDEGLDVARGLLADVGARLPESTLAAVLGILWNMLLLSVRRLAWTTRAESSIAREALTRLDVFWSMGAGLLLVDTARGAYFLSRSPLMCLRAGEELRIARSLAAAGATAAADGDRARAMTLAACARKAAEAHGSELARFYVDFMDVGYVFTLDNDWPATLERATAAAALGRKLGLRTGWEADALEQFGLWATELLGRFREVDARVEERLRDARREGHRFREVAFRTCFAFRHAILRDDPDTGERECEDALTLWRASERTFDNVAYWAHKTQVRLYLYRGDVTRGWEARCAERRRFERSLVSRVAIIRLEELLFRADVALMQAAWAKKRGLPSEMRERLAVVKRALRRIARSPLPQAVLNGLRIEGTARMLEGDIDGAVSLLRRAQEGNEAASAALPSAAINWALASLVGGDEGRERAARAVATYGAMAVPDIGRAMMVTVPGFPHPAWD